MNVFEALRNDYSIFKKIVNFNKIMKTFKRTVILAGVTTEQNQQQTDNGSKSKLNKKKPGKKIVSKTISPKLEYCNHNLITSIILDTNSASWATISKTTNSLSEWKYCNFDLLSCKMKSDKTFEVVEKIVENLPKSDIYIFEDMQISKILKIKNNLPLLLLNFGLMQLMSMLTTVLNMKENETSYPKVYYLKTNFAAKMFGSVVDGEKVSLRKKITEMLKDCEDDELLKLVSEKPLIDPYFRSYFLKQQDVHQELLSQVLILAIAFIELYSNENQ